MNDSHHILIKRLTLLVSTVFLLTAGSAHASTVYISDELTVPLRSGPTSGHRIVHRGLPSGTQMEVLEVDEAAGFSRIKTTRGTEGWIRSQYLVSEPIAKQKLAAAQRARTNAEAALAAEQAKVRELTESNRERGSTNSSNAKRIADLEAELAEITRISAGAITTNAENTTLQEVNARLQDELDDIAQSRAQLEDNTFNQALMIGGGLLFLGLIAGVAIKARPHRSGSAWT